jgi:hypothetical protein
MFYVGCKREFHFFATISPLISTGFQAIKFRYTLPADTGSIPLVGRYLRKQGFRNIYFHAPARAFVRGGSAKLTIVCLATEWTLPGVSLVCW